MKTVVIIHWDRSAYDSLRGLLTLAGRELDPAEYRIVAVTLGAEGWQRTLEETVNGGNCAFALTMSGIGIDLTAPDGTNFWEAAKLPIFTWYCDHPAYFPARHVIRSRYITHGYIFSDHARFHRDHLNPNGVAFSVHLGIPARPGLGGDPLPASARNGRLLFAKTSSGLGALERRWRETMPPLLLAVLLAATEELRGSSTAAFPGTIARLADAEGIHLAPNGEAMMRLISEADRYLRARSSNLIAERIKAYPVDVVGDWRHVDWTGAAARPLGTIDFFELARRVPAYTGSISISPLIEGSLHDRVFGALAAKVVPISDANAFARAHMPLLAPYSYAVETLAVEQAVEAVLADPGQAIEATEATYRAMLPQFSMRESMRRIATFCAMRSINAAL